MSLVIVNPNDNTRLAVAQQRPDVVFFPDFHAARQSFDDYVESRPSSRTTGHTREAYNRYLDKFLLYLRREDGTYQTPTLPIIQGYIRFLIANVTPSTAATQLAPIRRFLTILADQLCDPDGERYLFLHELRESVRSASHVANPPKHTETHTSAILQYGCWLRTDQLKELLGLINRQTIQGKRDYALMITGLYTGLRRAELARLTLAHFDTSSPKIDIIVGLQGKRNNFDNIPAPKQIYEAIADYVRAFNAGLHQNDPRRITQSSALWRQLTRSGRIMNGKKQDLGQYGVSRVVSRRYVAWKVSINPDYKLDDDLKPFTAHDMRRSCVLNAYLAGMPPDQIIRITRHKSLDMFMRYLGKLINYEEINVTTYGYNLA